MKVLFVHYGDDWIAGSEVALLELMRGLAGKGVTPFLWCNAPAMQRAAEEYGIAVRRDDFAYYFDYSSPPFSPAAYLRLVRKASALITATGAEIVHCNSAAPAQWMSLACRRKNVPWLINMHSPYLKRSRYVLGMHLADEVVAVTSAISKSLLNDGMEPARIKVIHNGFDEEMLLRGDATMLRAQLQIPANAVVAAIAGSLIHRKGHDILFAAMRQMPAGAHPFHLLVIGDGPQRSEFESLAISLPVHFLGHRADLGAILRDAVDFLVAPSRREAFGRVIMEAAFAGRPTIGSNVDGIPEAILDQVTGALVPPESPAGLAQAMARFIVDGPMRTRMGQAARKRARADFTIAKSADSMMATFREIRERHRQSPGGFLRRLRPYGTLLRKKRGP